MSWQARVGRTSTVCSPKSSGGIAGSTSRGIGGWAIRGCGSAGVRLLVQLGFLNMLCITETRCAAAYKVSAGDQLASGKEKGTNSACPILVCEGLRKVFIVRAKSDACCEKFKILSDLVGRERGRERLQAHLARTGSRGEVEARFEGRKRGRREVNAQAEKKKRTPSPSTKNSGVRRPLRPWSFDCPIGLHRCATRWLSFVRSEQSCFTQDMTSKRVSVRCVGSTGS